MQRLNEQLAIMQQSNRESRSIGAGTNQAVAGPTSQPMRLPSIDQSLIAQDGFDGSAFAPSPPSAYQGSPTDKLPTGGTEIGNPHRSQTAQFQNQISIQSLLQPGAGNPPSRKRSHSGFELQDEPISDVIAKGLITTERAMFFFNLYVNLSLTLNIYSCVAN